MAKAMYTVVGGATKQVKKAYCVIGGTTKKIKKVYAVVNGVTKLVWESMLTISGEIVAIDKPMVLSSITLYASDLNPNQHASYNYFRDTSWNEADRITSSYLPTNSTINSIGGTRYYDTQMTYLYRWNGTGYTRVATNLASAINSVITTMEPYISARSVDSGRKYAISSQGDYVIVGIRYTPTTNINYRNFCLILFHINDSGVATMIANYPDVATKTSSYSLDHISASPNMTMVCLGLYRSSSSGEAHLISIQTDGNFQSITTNNSFYQGYFSEDGQFFIGSRIGSTTSHWYYITDTSASFITKVTANTTAYNASWDLINYNPYTQICTEAAGTCYKCSANNISVISSYSVSDYGIYDIVNTHDYCLTATTSEDNTSCGISERKISRNTSGGITGIGSATYLASASTPYGYSTTIERMLYVGDYN